MFRFVRVAAVVLVLLFSTTSFVRAQAAAATMSGPQYDEAQMAEYKQAITTCDTPSLECLVHYTSRYIAIEWLTQVVGDAGTTTALPPRDGLAPPLGPTLGPGSDAGDAVPQTQTATRNGGVIGSLNGLISQMYENKPAATSTFVADVIHSAGFAQPAYAQGLGFASLSPILDLWKVFRNISYTFFALIFIVIGFMIMFRTKISGNAAVTAQQAIPSIIMSLIFVTFSYAIAGLLIDGMYLVMYLILGLFGTTLANTGGADLINLNIVQLGAKLFTATGFSSGALENNANVIDTFLEAFTTNPILNNDAVQFIGSLLLSLIFAIASLIATVKLFFELLKSYATIIISIVMAPVMLMMGAIPGKNAFTPWVKGLIGNLIAFPVVLLVLVIFYQFVGATGQQRFEDGGFMPPFLLGRGQADVIATLMGFALLLALPDVVKKVKETVGAKSGFGEMIANAGFANAKQAWSGKMPLGLNARNIAGAVGGLPVRMATGYAGGKAGKYIAEQLKLPEEQQKAWQKAGSYLGFASGPGLIRKAPQLAKFGMRNAGEAGFKVATDFAAHRAQEYMQGTQQDMSEGLLKNLLRYYTRQNQTSKSGSIPNPVTPPPVSPGTTTPAAEKGFGIADPNARNKPM